MRHRRVHRANEEVELNLAAMLDMAFQVLAFFVATYTPPSVEGQVNLRLPPPVGITREGTAPPGDTINPAETPKGLNTLVISAFSNPSGGIAFLAVGETQVGNLTALDNKLQTVLADKNNPFNQVIIQFGQELHYGELMRVIEVCTKQTLPDRQRLSKLSFVEAAAAGD